MEHPGDQTLLQRIASASSLTPSERRVAQFYEDTLPRSALLNLAEVCRATGVSSATVARFARRLGYPDFRALSLSLEREVQELLALPGDRLRAQPGIDPGPALLRARFGQAEADLRETLDRLDDEEFDAVARLVADSTRPLVLAAVASGLPFLRYLELLASYLRGDVTLLDGTDRWAHGLAGLTDRSVVLATAFDRSPVAIQRLLRHARGRGATTILITNRRGSPLLADADLSLFVASGSDSVFRSRAGLLVLLEALLDVMGEHAGRDAPRAAAIEAFFEASGGYLPS